MDQDAFSRLHPAVNFIFFLGALAFGMVIQHPAYMIAAFLGALCYFLLLKGVKGWKALAWMLPLSAVMALINPLFNHLGSHVLLTLFGTRYTLEALLYGCAVAGVFLVTLLWFGCYSQVMTGDKFTSLLGSLIPALSLLLVMVFRMVPEVLRRTRQVTAARRSIGKSVDDAPNLSGKAAGGMTVLTTLAAWALEGSIVTADSMRSRGYGTAKRTSFQIYRMAPGDWFWLGLILILMIGTLVPAFVGSTYATYTPSLRFAPLTGLNAIGFCCYCALVLIPTAVHMKEVLIWHISRSNI